MIALACQDRVKTMWAVAVRAKVGNMFVRCVDQDSSTKLRRSRSPAEVGSLDRCAPLHSFVVTAITPFQPPTILVTSLRCSLQEYKNTPTCLVCSTCQCSGVVMRVKVYVVARPC